MNLHKTLLLIIIIPCFTFGQDTMQRNKLKAHYSDIILEKYINTKLGYNYKNLILTIKTGKWDSGYTPIMVTMTNHSSDTLKYGWDSHCWEGFFMTNNNSLIVRYANNDEGCLSHIYYTEVLLPHKTVTYEIMLKNKLDTVSFHGKTKVGFYLNIHKGEFMLDNVLTIDSTMTKQKTIIEKYQKDLKKRTHIVWSNTVEI